MKKKLLAIFLCLLMVFAMGTPGVAVAESTGETESTADEPVQAVSFTRVAPLVKEAAASPIVRRALKAAAQVNDAVTNTEGDLILDKKATTVDGKTTVRLEVYSTGSSTTTVSTEPVDIVLVLDVSGSMDDPMESYTEVYSISNDDTYYYKNGNGQYRQAYYCDGSRRCDGGWYTEEHYDFIISSSHGGTKLTPKTGTDDTNAAHTQFYVKNSLKRIEALKSAVNSFIDNVSTKSPDSSIAIVKFAGDKRNSVGNDTYREDGWTYNYSQIVKNLTAVGGTGASTLKSAVNALRPAGATRSDFGMEHAQSIVEGAASDGRKKVVIMFTDGVPTSGNTFENQVANNAIRASKSIKNLDATVYTIGVFEGADGKPVTSLNGLSNTNKYMHLVSSNYKNAESMNTPGEATYPEGGKSYFLSAANASDVMNIFTQISQEVGGTTTELTQTSVIKDIVTPYFDLPANATDVTLKVAPCTRVDADGKREFGAEDAAPDTVKATIDQANNMVSVTGFNFKDEWCGPRTNAEGTTYGGHKLIIEFVITPKAGFLGGNDVVTNGENSGVYKDANATEPEKTFPVPKTDVKIDNITFDVTTNYTFLGAYAGNTVTQGDMKFNTKVMCNGVEIDLSKADYGLEDWQHEYVDIKTELKDANGNTIPASGLSGLYEDTTFTMNVTVSPKTTGSATEQSRSETRDIKVFLPHVTFKDSEIALGTTAPAYNANNYAGTVWKLTDGKTEQEVRAQNGHIVNNGVAPTLTFTYNPVEGAFTTDTPVKVTVTMPTTGDATEDVTRYVTFHHEGCTFANCKWGQTGFTDCQFIVHVKSFNLTITKTVDTVEPNQTFLFHIKKDGAAYMDVTVQVGADKTGSVTIKGLPVGSYTVTEDTAWSWRYALTGTNDRAVDLNSGVNGVVTIDFANKLTTHTWLSGETSCENRWSGNRILKNGQPLDNN